MKHKSFIFLLLFSLFMVSCSDKSDSQKAPDNARDTEVGNPFNPENPGNCIALDTDGDGVIDCQDPDMDNDGLLNEIDAFPKDKFEWLDSDGDGVGDNTDWAPEDPREQADFDFDTIGDNFDEDDDNDGVPDIFDDIGLKNNATEFFDVDIDRLGDNEEDDDSDNDGVPDVFDDLFWNKKALFDIDNDLVANRSDFDMDGDLIPNLQDSFPYDETEWADTDLDKLGNNIDPDDDNDGFPDSWEDFSENKLSLFDSDFDSVSNLEDAFPYNRLEWLDSDGDGVGDNSDPFPLNPLESQDTDGDGLGDNSDADVDNDGFVNCVPIDLDSIEACNVDKFPEDRFEWFDEDGDRIGDNSDEDDDNDGIPDIFDTQSFNKLYFSDYDRDRIPDSLFPESEAERAFLGLKEGEVFFKLDADTDNDGVPNIFDDLPFEGFEYFDIDGDKVGNKLDLDDDGDGVEDLLDRFTYDSLEWADRDNDLVGDNIDADDDNDGAPDVFDTLQNNERGWSDYNNDEIADNLSLDLDGDGKQNGPYSCFSVKGVWSSDIGDIDEDGAEDSACVINNEVRIITYRNGDGTDNDFNNCLILAGDDFNLQQECFPTKITIDTDYRICAIQNASHCIDIVSGDIDDSCVQSGASACTDILNQVKANCLSYNEVACSYPEYSAVGLSNRNDLFPYNELEWQDWDKDGLADNLVDADNDNDGVPDIFDDFPEDNVADQKWRFFDSDRDGFPNTVFYFDNIKGLYKYEYGSLGESGYIADADADNDLVDQGKVSCVRVSDGLVTGPFHNPQETSGREDLCNAGEIYDEELKDCVEDPTPQCNVGEIYDENLEVCVEDPYYIPLIIVDGTEDVINCFYEKREGLDYFPFKDTESSDVDGDRIGDNSDEDIDGDKQNNCTGQSYANRYSIDYIGGESQNNPLENLGDFISKRKGNTIYRYQKDVCDDDELPLVGRTNPFVDEVFDIDGDGFDTIPYCADTDCYYKNYDRDGDGLTDYEEYQLGSDPEQKDTDGDLVLDIYERLEGTSPIDALDFLDDDNDGVPNSIDPFPQGAYDSDSLLDQLTKAASCKTKSSQELCEPVINTVSYCQWVEDPNTEVPDPEDPTKFIFGKKCESKPVLITKDINLGDCINLSGQVIIESSNGSKITAQDFTNSVRCNPSDRILFNALEGSEVKIKDMIIEAKDVDGVFYSTGTKFTLENSIMMGVNSDMTKVIEYENDSGVVSIKNSTIRGIMEEDIKPENSQQSNMVNILSQELEIESSLIDCSLENHVAEEITLNSKTYFLDNFICINTEADNYVYAKNIVTTLGDSVDSDSLVTDSKAIVHKSNISTIFSDINIIRSAYDSMSITGVGISINPQDLYIKDRLNRVNGASSPIGNYKENFIDIESKESSLDYSKLFSSNVSGVLYCKNEQSDILPTYFSENPINSMLSMMKVETFNNNPNDILSSIGSFLPDASVLPNNWNENNDFVISVNAYEKYENDTKARVRLDSAEGIPEGLSTRLTGLTVDKKYKLIINLKAFSVAKLDIDMNAQFIDTEDASKVYELINIVKKEGPDTPDISYDNLEKKFIVSTDFNNSDVEFVFRAKKETMFLKINNNANSEHVFVNKIQLLESSEYNSQILGAPVPVCKEDETHLELKDN